jgi:hypothetical protein
MKTVIVKLFIIICCGDHMPNGAYQYEAQCIEDKTTYTVYTTSKHDVGDTLQHTQTIK